MADGRGARIASGGRAIVASFLGLAALAGLAVSALPPSLLALALGLAVLLPLLFWRPQWLIVPVIAFEMYFPWQPAADVVTVLFAARAALTLVRRWPSLRPQLDLRLLRPLWVVALAALLAFVAGTLLLEHGRRLVYGDGRVFVYWLWLLPVLAYAPATGAERWFARQLLWLAIVVSALAVVQGAFDVRLMLTGRVAPLDPSGAASVTRVQMAGYVFVAFGLFYAVAEVVRPQAAWRGRLLHLALVVLFVFGTLYNFGRAFWFWSVAGVLVTALVLGWGAGARALLVAAVTVATVGSVLSVARPEVLDNANERIVSILVEGGSRSSLGLRRTENDFAWRKLTSTAFLGMGFGGEYRPLAPGLGGFSYHTSYIHNGHLSLMLRIGLPGYLAYAALFGMLTVRAARRRADPRFAALAAATLAWLTTFAGLNLTQPDVVSAPGVTLLAFLVGTSLFRTDDTRPATASDGAG